MDDQRLGVANVGQQAEDLQRVDEFLARVVSSANAEGDDGAGAVGQIFFRARVVFAAGEAGIVDPLDGRILFEELGHGKGIF